MPPAEKPAAWAQTYLDFDWIIVAIASWLVPLLAFNWMDHTYFNSEAFWVLPIVCLLPRFYHETHPGSRRRYALYVSTAIILTAGSLLDLAFGKAILTFGPGPYIGRLADIPYEEFIFYLLGPIAMLMVYFWADEHFLKATNPQEQRLKLNLSDRLLQVAPGVAASAIALFVLGLGVKRWYAGPQGPWLPLYFSFLIFTAFLPVILFWRTVKRLVNWQALTLTVLYTLVTSIIWELTLGVPSQWWGYQPQAMLGLYLRGWQNSIHTNLPIEAVAVWMVAPFACIFFYEVVKALRYHPGSFKQKLLSKKGDWKASLVAPPPLPTKAPRR